MQTLTKFRVVPRSFVRSVMGKPYTGEEMELSPRENLEEKKTDSPTPKRFTTAFQAYLDTRLTLDDIMKSEAEKTTPPPKTLP